MNSFFAIRRDLPADYEFITQKVQFQTLFQNSGGEPVKVPQKGRCITKRELGDWTHELKGQLHGDMPKCLIHNQKYSHT